MGCEKRTLPILSNYIIYSSLKKDHEFVTINEIQYWLIKKSIKKDKRQYIEELAPKLKKLQEQITWENYIKSQASCRKKREGRKHAYQR